jgi:hypothetical protein
MDLASVSSGVVLVSGKWDGREVSITPLYEKAYTVKNDFPSHFYAAQEMLAETMRLHEKYCIDLIAVEDYLMLSSSQVSFSIGEFGGLVRGFHFEDGFPLLLNKPPVMRSFAADGRKIRPKAAGKRDLVDWAKEDFGFASQQRLAKQRSDCADAFWHAVLGVYTLLFIQGVPLNVLSEKRQGVWVNKKINGILDTFQNRMCEPTRRDCSAEGV